MIILNQAGHGASNTAKFDFLGKKRIESGKIFSPILILKKVLK